MTRATAAGAHRAPRWATVVLCLALAPGARAAEPVEPPTGRRAIVEIGLPAREPAALDSIPHPWPGRAMILSSAATALPILLWTRPHQHGEGPLLMLAATEVVAPSAGHLYAGLGSRALRGMVVRAVGCAMVVYGASSDSGEFDWNVIVVLLGTAVEGFGAAMDVVTVASDVERANLERVRAHVGLGMRPLPSGTAPALAVTVGF